MFDIGEIVFQVPEKNDIFDNYYDDFGNIPTTLYNEYYIFNLEGFINECIKKYDNCKLKEKNLSLIYFEENLNLSQFKTRLGYLICYYLNLKKNKKSFYKILFKAFLDIYKELEKKNITLFQKLRIITFYIKEIVSNNGLILIKLFFLNEYNSNNPYSLAYKLNKEEINNLNELSRLFLAYMQIDSIISYNYYIDAKSYSFTLGPLFVIKFHLLSYYEEFIFTYRGISDFYITQTPEKITVINEKMLFGKEIGEDDIIDLEDINQSKNYALSIAFEFRHEKNRHQKRTNINFQNDTSLFFVRDLNIQKIVQKVDNKFKDENGRIIESFISTDINIIKDLKTNLIYGELLNYKYYIKKILMNYC